MHPIQSWPSPRHARFTNTVLSCPSTHAMTRSDRSEPSGPLRCPFSAATPLSVVKLVWNASTATSGFSSCSAVATASTRCEPACRGPKKGPARSASWTAPLSNRSNRPMPAPLALLSAVPACLLEQMVATCRSDHKLAQCQGEPCQPCVLTQAQASVLAHTAACEHLCHCCAYAAQSQDGNRLVPYPCIRLHCAHALQCHQPVIWA
jgi:hypothetical protein